MSTRSKIIPCGDWLPDQPDVPAFGARASCDTAENVVPRTRTSFGPMPSFAVSATTALAGPPLGAFSAADASNNPGNYVGTATKLYAGINSTKPNFADKSGAVYAVPTGGYWIFTEGDGYVYASNGADAIQRVATATTSNFASLGGNSPKAKVIAAVRPGFLLCGDIVDVTVGTQPQGIRWSALGDFTDFPLVGSADAVSKQSDWQAVLGPHGRLKAIASDLASCNAALFFERGVFRMLYTGDDKIFDIQPVEKLRGTPAPRSVVQAGQIAYFLGYDGWYSFDGTLARPIGVDKINQTFFADCDPNYISQVQGTVDPVSGMCFWLYAGAGNAGGVANRILVFNPFVNRFSLIVGFTGASLFVGRSFGTSLDGIDALGYTLDSLPYSLDSLFLAGGGIALEAFNTDYKLGAFTGPNMAYTIDLAETQLSGGRRSRVGAVQPIVEGAGCLAQVASRQTFSNTITFSSAVSPNNAGLCHITSDGMYHRIRLTAPAGHTVKHVQGAQVFFTPSGKR